MWGDELVDPVLKAKHNAPGAYWTENTRYREQQCFLGLLGTHYQVPTENFGWPGGSMQSDIWCYLWWRKHETLDPDRVLVLVCHTDANRTSYYHANRQMFPNDPPWHRFVHSAWVRYAKADITPEWSSMVKQHLVLTDCAELHALRYQQSLLFWQGVQPQHAGVFQFCSMPPPILEHADNSILRSTCLQSLVLDPQLRCAQGHPNEKGHEIIRDLLITEIDRAILTEC